MEEVEEFELQEVLGLVLVVVLVEEAAGETVKPFWVSRVVVQRSFFRPEFHNYRRILLSVRDLLRTLHTLVGNQVLHHSCHRISHSV